MCEELNIQSSDALDSDEAGLVDISMKANFRALGARFGKQTQLVAAAIAASDAAQLHQTMRSTGSVSLEAGELGTVEITADDVVITETPREGWAVASEGGESVALDLTITDELRRAGLAREVVRAIQEARKNAGFEVSDRITLWWSSLDSDVMQMWADHADEIAGEVLATAVHNDLGGTINVDVAEFTGSIGIARN